jgi:hypothetical protein
VETPDGPVAIDEIRPGDRVLGWDRAADRAVAFAVTALHSRSTRELIEIRTAGQTIRTTREHPFRVEHRGWMPAGELSAADRLVDDDGSGVAVRSVRAVTLDRPVQVHNFEVDSSHTYFVSGDGVLVHNAGGCRKGLRSDATKKTAKQLGVAPAIVKASSTSTRKRIRTIAARFDPSDIKPVLEDIPGSGAPPKQGLRFPTGSYAKRVKIAYTGSRKGDFAAANQAVGIKAQDPDYVWHHMHDYDATSNTGTMYLVKHELHTPGKGGPAHFGGVWQYEQATGTAYAP